MRELALHLLDIAENSVAAGANHITLTIVEDSLNDGLTLRVDDDGKGMDSETAAKVIDPFYTTRTTRKVGLGIPLLKAAAEACDGSLNIHSEPGKGTTLEVFFRQSHIDRMPLGNLADTCLTLVVAYPDIHWVVDYRADAYTFHYDHRDVTRVLDGIPLTEPSILQFLRSHLEEGFSVQVETLNTIQ